MSIYLFYLLIHIFSAMFWVGGMLFYVFVFIVIIRDPNFKNVKLLLLEKTALQFRKLSYFIFLFLFISGISILHAKGFLASSNGLITAIQSIPNLFLIKIFLFFLLVLSSVYHDFFSGPSAFSYAEVNPALYEKFRKRSSFFGRLNLLLSLLIAILGILGSRGVM